MGIENLAFHIFAFQCGVLKATNCLLVVLSLASSTYHGDKSILVNIFFFNY